MVLIIDHTKLMMCVKYKCSASAEPDIFHIKGLFLMLTLKA